MVSRLSFKSKELTGVNKDVPQTAIPYLLVRGIFLTHSVRGSQISLDNYQVYRSGQNCKNVWDKGGFKMKCRRIIEIAYGTKEVLR